MESAEAAELRGLLAYPPNTAGGQMTPAFVAIAPDLRADQAIAALRQVAEEAETVNYVYVLEESGRLLGVLSLHQLVLNRSDTPVRALMAPDVISVPADADQEAAARLLTERNLLALPVVDRDQKLLGIITQDDVADVLEEEATEDIERLGGSQPLDMPYRMASIGLLFRRRIVWLLALFVAEAYTGTVMRAFERELASVVALTFFVPLLIGTGGNVGSQVTTTLVRAMAVGELRLRDVRWVLGKEIVVGLTMGLVMAVAAFGRAEILGVGMDIGAVVALTIAAICIWSSTVAAVLPLLLQKARVDPAVVSAPMITTLVDGTGLVIYFSIAKVLLHL
jgi:magnesium transporter